MAIIQKNCFYGALPTKPYLLGSSLSNSDSMSPTLKFFFRSVLPPNFFFTAILFFFFFLRTIHPTLRKMQIKNIHGNAIKNHATLHLLG